MPRQYSSHSSDDVQQLLRRVAELERRVGEQEAQVRERPQPAAAAPAAIDPVSDRRSFMRTAAAAATGAIVAGAAALTDSAPAVAANNDPIIIGSALNTGTQSTGLAVSGTTAPYGFGITDNGLNSLSGKPAVLGHAKGQAFGYGVMGLGENGFVGVYGTSNSGTGVIAASTSGTGLDSSSQNGFGAIVTGGRSAMRLYSFKAAPPERSDFHIAGELEADTFASLWHCVANGTPGTWRKLSGADTAGALHVLPSTIRVYDSRPGENPTSVTKGTLNTDQERVVDCTLGGAIPAGATAAYVNITIVSQSPLGFLAAFKNGIPYPGNSTLNWDRAGQVVANSAVVALDDTANFRVRARNPVHYLVDVIGYYR